MSQMKITPDKMAYTTFVLTAGYGVVFVAFCLWMMMM